MDFASKQAVALQLRDFFGEMRKIPSPGGYCSVGRQQLTDELFWTGDPAQPFSGPFDTEAELNNAMIQTYAAGCHSKYKANFYTHVFADVYRNHEPTFSHADFQRKNVMVRKRETGPDDAPPELVMIDWEFSDWYPSYWEYARAILACGMWSDDWSEWVVKILEPFNNEYAWMEMLFRNMWG